MRRPLPVGAERGEVVPQLLRITSSDERVFTSPAPAGRSRSEAVGEGFLTFSFSNYVCVLLVMLLN